VRGVRGEGVSTSVAAAFVIPGLPKVPLLLAFISPMDPRGLSTCLEHRSAPPFFSRTRHRGCGPRLAARAPADARVGRSSSACARACAEFALAPPLLLPGTTVAAPVAATGTRGMAGLRGMGGGIAAASAEKRAPAAGPREVAESVSSASGLPAAAMPPAVDEGGPAGGDRAAG